MLQAQCHAVLQAQHDAWMSSSAHSPAAEEEEGAWIVSSQDHEMPQAEVEAAEEVFSLFMAAEGVGSEDDSGLSSNCSNVAEMGGSEASSTTCGFSGSSCSGQNSSEEPSTAIAVNILCLGDCKLNGYNFYSKQYSDSSLLLDLVLLLVSFTVSKNVVTAVHLASRMGLLGADQSLVRGTPAASWRLLPTRRLQPGSTRPAAGAVVEKVAVTASGGALKPFQDGSAGSTRQLYLSAGVLCGWRTMVAPSSGGLKEAAVAPQRKRRLDWVVGGTCGSRDVRLKVLGAGSGGGFMEGSAAQQGMRKEGRVGGGREVASRALVVVSGGSAALQSRRQQQGRLGVATPGVREAASRVLAALFGSAKLELGDEEMDDGGEVDIEWTEQPPLTHQMKSRLIVCQMSSYLG
ncbi:unnamed protein product [Closterium sp. NIES-65]|nr:unnamed protein product [Closterium sp. NIES-65]CAI5975288.1 unnamed protein product [Closterium sp. NIES-65]CAI6009100.1 unnamed protein product [Closterium sp. NIES-65]